ncbi:MULTISPECIES: type IV pilus biogenesis/stability protein PilW [Halomonas]|uniref:Photosystem I assembly protein Ycf3 n=1 Tax=Halomonas chromatireducens TaxID=507626 RepID=A0A109UKR5_9GAMM|nr:MULTISPECIES: type IV pilus biogenesis/stability protein PilW [Halomonas]AMC99333.1 photosystem I assembly protein Ycf3 [Halomonas chromatireducens]MBZ0331102.1 type IV pilus biogenesis/stability protein PilW [Halomonas sp. ANAO-440]
MTRCPSLTSRLRPLSLVAMLAGSLWLTGCASQAERSDGSSPAEAFTELGMAYLEQDNLPRAIAALNRALENDARNPQALQAMAIVYQRQGEDELADETFQQALKADPDYSRARNNYAAFLYDKGRTAEACEQLELASRDTQYANRAQLFANLGQCYWELGDLAKARSGFERAQSLEPRSPRSYFALAELELMLGNPEHARQQLDAYIRLAGMTPNAQALANDIAVARSGNTAVTPDSDTVRDAP